MSSIPKIRELLALFIDTKRCYEFLKSTNAFDIPQVCPTCGGNVTLHDYTWRCKVKGCRKHESYMKTSFFGRSRLPMNEIMEIGYYWLAGVQRNTLMTITGHSPNTITDYIQFYRELVCATLDDEESDAMIGGPGIRVQVDESKFGKVKYHRGHRVDGVWVIGGVEETEERRMFLKRIRVRNSDTGVVKKMGSFYWGIG